MKIFSLNFSKKLAFTRIIYSNKFRSPMFNIKNFSSENLQNVNFAFHNNTKPKLRIKTNPIVSPLNFMAQKDVPFFVIKESSIKKRDKKSKPTISTGELKYSSYKLNDVCKLIRGKYIRHALEILELNNTKGAKLIKKELSEYLERREKQMEKEQERILQKKIEKENEDKNRLNENNNYIQQDENSDQNEEISDKIKLENIENSEESNLTSDIETEITEKNPENLDYIPYVDFKIAEIYVGRKIGNAVPSPRAKGKVDRIFRSISKLYVHIEKVPAEKFFQKVAIGKADLSFAKIYRKSLFMNNASLKELKSFSFITTSRGRYYRKIQFDRLVTHLRDKFYKEKGIKLNTEIIRDQLMKQLGKQLAHINPNNLSNLLNSGKDSLSKKINEKIIEKFNSYEEKKKVEIKDRSYRARNEEFNKNYKKIE